MEENDIGKEVVDVGATLLKDGIKRMVNGLPHWNC